MSALPPGYRGWHIAALTALVAPAHLWLVGNLLPPRLGEGAAEGRPHRIEVMFVRELAPTPPPAVAPAPAPRRPRPAAMLPPAPAASVPQEAQALAPTEIAPLPAPDLEPVLPGALAVAPATPPVAAAASAPTAFEWPPSTRLSYRLNGNYRGAVEGQAQVEWLRSGTRYQVFMDLGIGPSFAPLISRRVSSEGEITADGLSPRRYDEETRAVLRETRRQQILLDADVVRLADGSSLPRPAGVQDSASQFVQLTWMFTTEPQLLQPGRSIELPLALPRHLESWTYDIIGSDTLATAYGSIDAIHVKPRREPRPGGDLTAEIWVAPSLQYLPVRILIRQDADTWIDLVIDRLPEQAEQADPRR